MKTGKTGRGFTLIELLITIAVLGIFLSSMYGILAATLKARESINNDYKAFQWGPIILDQIASDLAHVYFYDLDGDAGLEGVDDTFGSGGDSDSINFIAAIRSKTPVSTDEQDFWSSLSEVGYFLAENPDDPEYMILYRREDFFVDHEPYKGSVITEVYDRMRGFNVVYYQGDEEEEEGYVEWNSKEVKKLPRGVWIWIKLDLPSEKGEPGETWEFNRMVAFPNGTQYNVEEEVSKEKQPESQMAGGTPGRGRAGSEQQKLALEALLQQQQGVGRPRPGGQGGQGGGRPGGPRPR